MHLLDQIYSILCLQIEVAAIQKAINSFEVPIKQKHVRSAIISTFQGEYGQTFWAAVAKLPIMENKIVAWKLCYVIHKILREGHPICLYYSCRHIKVIEDMGTNWAKIKDEYGPMIKSYTQLLINKLEFHKRNPLFSGSIDIASDQLEALENKDLSLYYQLVVEIMDYLDKILNLQFTIFNSLDMSKSNSQTKIGQLKLTPLLPCVQDASRLYNYCIKILFRLHSSLPIETLHGHRNRFFGQYKLLYKFYEDFRNLQYFKKMITIPSLPEEPPDFLVTHATESYLTEFPNDDDSIASSSSGASCIKLERDTLIKHLQEHSESLKTEIDIMLKNHKEEVDQLHSKIAHLENKLATNINNFQSEETIDGRKVFKITNVFCDESKAKNDLELYYLLRNTYLQLLCQKTGKNGLKEINCLQIVDQFNGKSVVAFNDVNKQLEIKIKKEFKMVLSKQLRIVLQDVMKNKNKDLIKINNLNMENYKQLEDECLNCLKIYEGETIGFYQQVLAAFKLLYPYINYFGFIARLINVYDSEKEERMRICCNDIINNVINIIENSQDANICIKVIEERFNELCIFITTVLNDFYVEKVSVNIADMNVTVREAINKMNDILTKMDDKKDKMLDSNVSCTCTDLMNEISSLILKSKVLQAEIIAQGKQSSSASKDLYTQNQLWSDGFISAAKSIANSATFFVNTVDRILKGDGKMEELIVAAQDIAAITIQLIFASKVKADVTSQSLSELIFNSKKVILATNSVINAIKESGVMKVNTLGNMNLQEISTHQAKLKEIEIQVKILELEKNLQDERQKLVVLRKQKYQI